MSRVRIFAGFQSGALARVSIVLFALAIMAFAGCIAVWRVWQDRQVTLEAARQELATFAAALGKQIEAMVADGVGAAMAGANVMRLPDPPAPGPEVLRAMLTGGDYVRALFVLQPNHTTVAGRRSMPGPHERPPDPAELASAAHDVWFGPVREGDDDLLLPIARRTGDGQWAGALIDLGDLDIVYGRLSRLESAVALVTTDGMGLVQLPITATSMRNFDVSATSIFRQYLQLPPQAVTLLDGPDIVTGEPRLFAAYRMEGLPAITSAGRSRADALQGWRKRTSALVVYLALWTLVVMVFAMGLQVLYNRRWAHLRRVAAAQGEVAEARRAELDARQSLTRELLVTQERERARLAGELHDGVGQNLSLLRNRVVLLRRTGLPPAAEEHAAALLDLAGATIEDLRGVAHNLRPMHLEELGLTSALKALAERTALSTGLQVHARIEDVDDVLQGERAVHVYRIAQEAINNVLRHAGATNLWVEVIRDIDCVELRIRDDGRGLDATGAGRGLGLSSITERSAILGATADLRTGAPAGTLFSLRIPVLPAGEEEGTGTPHE